VAKCNPETVKGDTRAKLSCALWALVFVICIGLSAFAYDSIGWLYDVFGVG
jgi:hypothetical protein